jgi:hypothetical protein
MPLASSPARAGRVARSHSRAAALLACGLFLGGALCARPALAACAADGAPWVAIDLQGGDWPHGLRENLLADLRASLRLRGIAVCLADAEGPSAPLAVVELHVSGAQRVLVSIDVHDAITDKRVLRNVDLHKVAPDARGLLLAQAVDELLRASWVELSLQDAPPPSAAPPPQVARAVNSQLRVTAPLPKLLGARFELDYYSAGQTLLGPDALLELWFADHFGASIGLGARAGLTAHSARGRVETDAFTLSTGVMLPVWPAAARYNLVVTVAAHMAELKLKGLPHAGARGDSLSGLSITARAAISGWLRISDLVQLSLEIGAGAPIRSIGAYDERHEVLGTAGLALHTALSLGVLL